MLLGLAAPLLLYCQLLLYRPAQTNLERPLFQGIFYRREYRRSPRPIMLHILRIHLQTPGIQPLVTPGNPTPDLRETHARTTSEFLQEFQLQVAVNANFFYPFREDTPWDFYPHSGDRVNAVGLAISNHNTYSPTQANWVVLCFLPNQTAQILAQTTCPSGTTQAVAGSALVVSAGRKVTVPSWLADADGIYSRTGVAIDASGRTLWLIAVDDKQPLYSEGVSLEELADIILELGATAALNLDGGGSTTMVTATDHGPVLLNAPIHTKIPMRERPVANHLGFYANPLIPRSAFEQISR